MLRIRIGSHVLVCLCFWTIASQSTLAQPASLGSLYSSIQAQEASFPLPQTTETITVANIDVSQSNSSDPVISYSIPVYSNGTHSVAKRSSGPCTGNRVARPNDQSMPVIGKGPCLSTVQLANIGGQLTVTNILHLNVAFSISGWNSNESAATLTVTLGSLPPQTVSYGSTQIVFNDVSDTSPQLTVTFSFGGLPAAGVLPLQIDWQLLAAGAITIPVLPVSIVYAPIVDAQQKNTASAASGISSAITTTATFSMQSSSSVPVDSSFQNVVDITQTMQALGPVLQKIPNGIAQGVGTGLSTIAGLLGSATASQTDLGVSASQNSLLVGSSQTITQTALASQGGPGVGDLISYYYNARVVWFSNGQTMRLAVLGFDGMVQINAGKLSAALLALKNQPPGTIDSLTHLNADSLTELLNLDPFCKGQTTCDPTAELSSPRFVLVSSGPLEVAGGTFAEQFSHQFSTTDLKSQQNIVTDTETDKAGFLSFLGIGVTNTRTIQTTITQGTSLQNSVGAIATQSFTFNSNPAEHYSCEVYFDVVFGSFVFRLVPDTAGQPLVTGTLVDPKGKLLVNTKVVATIGSKQFTTASDSSGRFAFRLPGVKHGMVRISASTGNRPKTSRKSAEAQIVIDPKTSHDLKLQVH